MSEAFEPAVKATIDVTDTKIQYILGNQTLYSLDQVRQLIQEIIRLALELTIPDVINWIEGYGYVAKRTGQLRQQLIKHLKMSKVDNWTAKLILGVDTSVVDYVQYLNKMSTSNVRHNGEVGYAYYNGHYGGTRQHPMRPSPARVILDDPNAIAPFWGLMIENARTRFKLRLRDAIKALTGAVGLGAKSFTTQLKVTR